MTAEPLRVRWPCSACTTPYWPPEVTIQWLAVVIPFALLALRPLRRLSRPYKILVWFVISTLVSIPAAFAVVAIATARAISSFLEGGAPPSGAALSLQLLLVVLLSLGVAAGYRIAVFRVIGRDLRPGAPPPPPGPAADAGAEQRLRWIGAAQHGNVTLYSGRNPFLGAGDTARAWTIAVELDRTPGPRDGSGSARPLVEIDPVELHTFVRERLAQTSAQSHPAGIINLRIRDQIVATGRAGVIIRVLTRILALTSEIWPNDKTGQPIKRSLIAYDH
ncbi:hypothetical protein [Nonomuraea sp. GTA35]|uniref:hypothetical protein n=1 Tax=Nonomuraea sp. GTA35 TaxID=1676746 RepID=UPI0035BF6068